MITAPIQGLIATAVDLPVGEANRVMITDVNGDATTDADLTYNATTNVLGGAPVIYAADGTVGAPAYAFASATSSGVWNVGSAVVISSGGAGVGTFNSSGLRLGALGAVNWTTGTPQGGTVDLSLFRDAANILAQRNGTAAQVFNIYNTYTSAAVNEGVQLSWTAVTNMAVLRTFHNGATPRNLVIAYGNTTDQAVNVPTSFGDTPLEFLRVVTSTVGNAAGINVGNSSNINATSGTSYWLQVNGGFSPSTSSTQDSRSLVIAPTINYAGGGSGRVQGLRIAPVNTALPTGNNGAIVLSATAAQSTGLNGIQLFNTTDETTNTERGVLRFASNVLELITLAQGTGTVRGINIAASGGSLGFFGVTPASRAAAYTVTNLITDRAYDADATTVAELADVLGTLIADLRTYGLVQ